MPSAPGVRLFWAMLLGLLLSTGPAVAEQRGRVMAPAGVALAGFDPVAYFTDGRAVPGRTDIALRWRGVRWHFATAAHRAAFEANPKAYVPQFGGLCALSVVRGEPEPGHPEHWTIVDGRLYFAAGAAQLAQVMGDPAGTIRNARSNWAAARAD